MSFAVTGRRRASVAGTGAPPVKPRFPKIVPHSLFVLYAPRSPPRAPGLAMRQARSPPVAQSEAVVVTGIARGASTVARLAAGTTRGATTTGARRTGVGAEV